MIHELFKEMSICELLIPYVEGEVFQEIQQKHEMIKEDYLDEGIYVSFYVAEKEKFKYKRYQYHKVN